MVKKRQSTRIAHIKKSKLKKQNRYKYRQEKTDQLDIESEIETE